MKDEVFEGSKKSIETCDNYDRKCDIEIFPGSSLVMAPQLHPVALKKEGTMATMSTDKKKDDAKIQKEEEMKAKQEQLKKEQQQAQEQINALLNQTRPKNLGQGLTSGISNILGGALGAIGMVVVAPVAGGAMGLRGGGLIGGVVGVAGGAVVGVVGAAALAIGGG